MIIPTTHTVIRFLAVYGHGFTFPVRHLILGHGYQRDGLSHATLSNVYKVSPNEKTYAGYLGVDKGELKVVVGGSKTLQLMPSPEYDAKLEHELREITGLKAAVLELFPLVLANKVRHVLVAQQ